MKRWRERFRRTFCPHGERDQGHVGYCQRCGHFLRTWSDGFIWVRYVLLPSNGSRPSGLPPRVERRWPTED
jgi:hypothetical protein